MRSFSRILLICWFFSSFCAAQEFTIDQFESLWNNAAGAQKLQLIDQYFPQIPLLARTAYLEEAIHIARDRKLQGREAWLYLQLGVTWYSFGDYPEALKYYHQALSLYEQIGDEAGMGRTYLEMATLVKKQNDYVKTKAFLDHSMRFCTSARDSSCIGTTFNTLGLAQAEQEDWDKAEQYYWRAKDYYLAIRDTVGLGYLFANLSEVAAAREQFSKAIDLLETSTKYKTQAKDLFGIAINVTNTGELYFKQNKYRQAADFFLKSSNVTDHADLRQWNFRYASKCYAQLGKTEEALAYLTQSYELKDSILSVQRVADLAEMETKYETENKIEKIKQQQLDLENQQQKFRIQMLTLGGGAFALLLLGLFGFLLYRQQQQTMLQEKEVVFQKQLLNNSLEVQEEERKRIAKDLHDGIGQQLTGLKLAWQNLAGRIVKNTPAEKEKINKLQTILASTAIEVRSISHQMMPRALQEFGLTTALEDLIDHSFSASNIHCTFEHHGLDQRLPEKTAIHLYRVFQELFNNILKHAAATEVDLQITQRKNQLVLMLEDNGQGFSAQQQNCQGHGMMNITSRLKSLDGQIDIQSDKGKGTLVVMKIPVR